MTISVSMLNHPSTNPHKERRAYFPHLRMEFTLDRNPVASGMLTDARGLDSDYFVSLAVKNPGNPAEVMIIDMPRDAQVVWADDTPNDTP